MSRIINNKTKLFAIAYVIIYNVYKNNMHRKERDFYMMYPLMTLDDNTEIVYSDVLVDGKVKIYIEKPDQKDCFHHLTCYLPSYELDDVYGFNENEVNKYLSITKSTAHLIIENEV